MPLDAILNSEFLTSVRSLGLIVHLSPTVSFSFAVLFWSNVKLSLSRVGFLPIIQVQCPTR
jgi:hypothetical protein